MKRTERAGEAEWHKWFYFHADFGSQNSADIRLAMKLQFMRETGKNLPEPANHGFFAGSGETNLDEIE
jgi:hypothetical protein